MRECQDTPPRNKIMATRGNHKLRSLHPTIPRSPRKSTDAVIAGEMLADRIRDGLRIGRPVGTILRPDKTWVRLSSTEGTAYYSNKMRNGMLQFDTASRRLSNKLGGIVIRGVGSVIEIN